MSYYRAGDFSRGGGYYRGYYSSGGLFSKVLGKLGGLVRSPLGSAALSFIPGGKIAAGVGETLGSIAAGHTYGTAVQPGPASLEAQAAMSHAALASAPGHSMQAATSGAMMPSHAVQGGGMPGGMVEPPAGTPGHTAHRHAARGRARPTYRRRRGRGRARPTYRRRRRSRGRAGDYLAAGDVRRSAGGRFLPGHRWPHKRRKGRGRGKVSFTTRDGRRVSFTPRGG